MPAPSAVLASRAMESQKTALPLPIQVFTERIEDDPVLDTATSHALLRRVASGEITESLRLYTPDPAVMFSMLDAHRPGFEQAERQAQEAGFPGVFRLAGGHAALFHSECLAFAWAMPVAEKHDGIRSRFEMVSHWICQGLIRVGVPAQVGEVPGEYCPGEYSVNASGKAKLMGVGQRVIRGAAHVGGVIVVRHAEAVRDVLSKVYETLELDWKPETAGAVEDSVPGITTTAVREALLDELSQIRRVEIGALPVETRDLGRELTPWHSPRENPKGRATALGRKVVAVSSSAES